ncbi:hypothetical protein [Bordetella hinzii]|uniref:hypothetical protein n=1 Tax=Bordetella hinzii TaxID=103855 RepID=UPI000671C989|nr:hypothetical protein [Bordetella hinzii]AKQ57173.1 hypothetical protein ACR54_03885 [Bordetella hinzii]AKQ61641.1 hypothetical protein ACR55_03797 [Bordetella hinzii]MBZ0076606.1 hypothetical protein [Bordetella hinzii]MBZ0080065.1 hypothetical protein [Bordetella hinzii]MBZ0084574.1 hypothetical protein [Bordetella hinzii]
MKKICAIGDSHLGALLKAWGQIGDSYGDVVIDFFPKRSVATRALEIHDSVGRREILHDILVVGEKNINVDDYDLFLVVALGLSIVPLLDFYRRYRTDQQSEDTSLQLVSQTCADQAIRGLLAGSVANQVGSALMRHTTKPVFFVGQARPSEYALLKTEGFGEVLKSAIRHGDLNGIDAHYRAIVANFYGDHFIDQPEVTRNSAGLTIGSYSVADPSDSGENSSFSVGDFWHMNVRYGRLSMQKILQQIGVKELREDVLEFPATRRIFPGDLGIVGDARVALFDGEKKDFSDLFTVPPGGYVDLDLKALGEHLNYKYKIQERDPNGKWVDKVPYKWLIEESITPDGIKYIFFPRASSKNLVVIFQAINETPGYNYIGTLRGVRANCLYIKDDYGDDPKTRTSYYLGPDKTSKISDAVQELIKNIVALCDTEQGGVTIYCGSSKGGYAALYHGHLAHADYVIAGGPQVLLGNFLNSPSDRSIHPPILRYLAGSTSPEAVAWANELLFNVIEASSTPYPSLYIHVGEREPHYEQHVVPLLSFLRGIGAPEPNIDLGDYYLHAELDRHFPSYLLATVNKILSKE